MVTLERLSGALRMGAVEDTLMISVYTNWRKKLVIKNHGPYLSFLFCSIQRKKGFFNPTFTCSLQGILTIAAFTNPVYFYRKTEQSCPTLTD